MSCEPLVGLVPQNVTWLLVFNATVRVFLNGVPLTEGATNWLHAAAVEVRQHGLADSVVGIFQAAAPTPSIRAVRRLRIVV